MPQSNVIAQVNAKSQGTTQNHQADCTSVLSQGKLRKRKKRNETFCSGSFNLSSVYWTAALCLRKNDALLSGWDYLYCPRCHMDLKLRRSISVRDLSAIRPSTVGSMFSLTGFIGVPKPLPWRQKLCPSISCVAGINAACASCGQNKKWAHVCILFQDQHLVESCLESSI